MKQRLYLLAALLLGLTLLCSLAGLAGETQAAAGAPPSDPLPTPTGGGDQLIAETDPTPLPTQTLAEPSPTPAATDTATLSEPASTIEATTTQAPPEASPTPEATATQDVVPATSTPTETPLAADTPAVTATYTAPQTQLPLPSASPTQTPASTLVPQGGFEGASDTFAPMPTPDAPAREPTRTPSQPQDPHVGYSATTDSCAACHRSHTAAGIVQRQTSPEENVCLGCHMAGGTGVNVQPAFASYTNTATRFFEHDVARMNGVHHAGETTGADFGGANRHVECEDCHEPHKATRGSAEAPMLQRVMDSVAGVDPAWTGAGAPASFSWLPQAGRENQVCFKCHSGFTTLPTYTPDGWNGSAYAGDGLRKLTSADVSQVPDSRDLAREFNPYNASFHPVVAPGRNQSIPAGSWAAGSGMSQTSIIYCADCHNNPNSGTQGLGAHGSPLLHLLLGANGGQSNYSTVFVSGIQPSNQSLCFKCHDYATYANNGSYTNTNFRRGSQNLHDTHTASFGGTCYMCHDTHGSEQQHLINFDASTDGGITFFNGANSQTAWTGNGCSLQCHGKDHGGLTYP